MPSPHIDWVALRGTCVVATGQQAPASCGAGEGGGHAAVLEGARMAAIAGHCQQLLAGRASRGSALSPAHLLSYLLSIAAYMRYAWTLLTGFEHPHSLGAARANIACLSPQYAYHIEAGKHCHSSRSACSKDRRLMHMWQRQGAG
jgi:hypothetical protein